MEKCKFDYSIDDYLLDNLNKEEREKFEEHYFNCQHCFEKLEARDVLLAVIRNKGQIIFQDEVRSKEKKETFFFEKIVSFLTPKQWAYAAVSMVLLLFVSLMMVTFTKKPPPQFFLNGEEVVRGESISLIAPVIDIETVPSKFVWQKSEKDVEYKIYIYNHELIWTASTKENYIYLPEEIKNLMKANRKYSWQVKAFSPQGILTAVSPKVQFKITSIN